MTDASPMIRLEARQQALRRRHARRATSLSLDVARGELCVLVGPSGCGKTTTMKMVNRLVEPTSGPRAARRRGRRAARPRAGAPAGRLRHPAGRAVPAPERARQRRAPCRGCSAGTASGRARAPTSCSSLVGLDPSTYGGALPSAAVGRAAPARRGRPRARRRPARAAHGRAVQRRRPGGPRAAAGRVPAAAARARHHGRARHPRHRRGGAARRPRRGAARGRPARAVRAAAPTSSARLRRTSSRPSSAPTARSSGCR